MPANLVSVFSKAPLDLSLVILVGAVDIFNLNWLIVSVSVDCVNSISILKIMIGGLT